MASTTATRLRDALAAACRAGPVEMPRDEGKPRAILFGPPGRESTVCVMVGPGADRADVADWLAGLAATVGRAHDFSLAEPPSDPEGGREALPRPTADEVRFFNAGLVPLPFPVALFEYDGAGGRREVLVAAADDPDDPRSPVTMYEVTERARGRFHVSALASRQRRLGSRDDVAAMMDRNDLAGRPGAEEAMGEADAWQDVSLLDPFGLVADLRGERDAPGGEMAFASPDGPNLLVYLLVMLGATSTELTRVEPGKNANRLRRAKGFAPARATTVVRLVPRAVSDAMAADGGGAAAWRRIHWRRSHPRRLASGKVVVVCRHVVGYRRLDGTTLEPNAYVATAALAGAHRVGPGRPRGQAPRPPAGLGSEEDGG